MKIVCVKGSLVFMGIALLLLIIFSKLHKEREEKFRLSRLTGSNIVAVRHVWFARPSRTNVQLMMN